MGLHRGLFITGTDTDVGKTWVTAALAAYAAKKVHSGKVPIRVWKPVQTGVRISNPEADSYRLVHGSGLPQSEASTVTITMEEPLAPWMAAERAGISIDWEALTDEAQRRLAGDGLLLVEGAGGLLVPITEERTVADLAVTMGLPLLIVARTKLGTVNHTLLTIEGARSRGLEVAGVILNGYTEGEERSLAEQVRMIETFGRVPVWGTLPWLPMSRIPSTPDEWLLWREVWTGVLEERLCTSVMSRCLFE